MLNHPHGYPSGFPSQAGSNPPHGFSSQAGSNPSRGFNSGFSSQDGSNNIPPGFSSAFSAGFSSQNGSNQAYGSTFSGLFTSPIFVASPKPIIISISHTFVMLGRNSST